MPNKDVRVSFTFRNNFILTKMEEKGITSVAELCRQLDQLGYRTVKVHQSKIGRLINMKEPAQNSEGAWTQNAMMLARFFNSLPEDLFSDMQKQIALKRNRAEAEVTFAEIQALTARPTSSPETLLRAKEFSSKIRVILGTLPVRQGDVLRMRFGIDCEEMSLAEIAEKFGVTPGRIQQIEAKALRNLKHPSKSKPLTAGIVTDVPVKLSWGVSSRLIFDEEVLNALRDT